MTIILADLQQSKLKHKVYQLLQQDAAPHDTCCSACSKLQLWAIVLHK